MEIIVPDAVQEHLRFVMTSTGFPVSNDPNIIEHPMIRKNFFVDNLYNSSARANTLCLTCWPWKLNFNLRWDGLYESHFS